jgi:para-aminobenzoate synthetase component 2
MTDILVVDNHDSFVHILVDQLIELGARVTFVEADAIEPHAAAATIAPFNGVLISPGPGTPARAGASVAVVRAAFTTGTPLLGVCLGHQAIAEAFGGEVGEAPELMHGIASQVRHDGTGVFTGLPQPFAAGRYHSLAVTRVPDELVVTARTASGTVMGLAHRHAPIAGVQFHPESVLTDGGYLLLGNWLSTTGMTDAATRGARMTVRR